MKRTKIDAMRLALQLGNWQRGHGTLRVRLKERLVALMLNGELLDGERLPPERRLADILAVSRNTVVGAYELLREDGFLETRRASGSTIHFADDGRRVRERRSRDVSSVIGLNEDAFEPADVIDFAVADLGLPSAFDRYLCDLTGIRNAAARGFTYDPHGLPELREALAEYHCKRGLPTSVDEILVTSGGQQSISLLIALFLERGDTAMVENPTFFVALDALRVAGARLTALPAAARWNALRETLVHSGARLAYVVPTLHNPTGETMAPAARESFAAAADSLGLVTIEDTVLEELGYTGEAPAPVAAFSSSDRVVTAGSLNKLFWSGLRVGWVRANSATIAQLARLKTVTELGNNIISQTVAVAVLRDFDRVRAVRRRDLQQKLQLLTGLLERHLPSWTYAMPDGGFCLWVRLPVRDARPFTSVARRFGVNVIAGSSMTIDDSCIDRMRLVFTAAPESIAEGIVRLSRAWQVFESSRFASRLTAPALAV